MLARIYKPAKTAMQSGRSKTKAWVLEFEAATPRKIDPLMGWTGASDMMSGQVRLYFDTQEEAIAYAKEKGLPHQVAPAQDPQPVIKAYSDNFAFRRRKPWTH